MVAKQTERETEEDKKGRQEKAEKDVAAKEGEDIEKRKRED